MDSALSRCACRLSLILIAFILLMGGVPAASVRPADNRRLFMKAEVITRDAEASEALITGPLSEALESSGLFSSIAAMSAAGKVHLTARLDSAVPSSFSTEDAARLMYPYLGPFLAESAPHISVSRGYADFPAGYLLFRASGEETVLQFSQSVSGYLAHLSGRLQECGGIRVYGIAEEELTVTADPALAAEYGIEFSRLHTALSSLLSGSTGAGLLESGEVALPLFITPDIGSIGGLAELPVSTATGRSVPLRELARICLDISSPRDPACSPEGEAAVIAEISPLSSGDISFYHALSKAAETHAEPFGITLVPSGTISGSMELFRLFPLALLPLFFLLLIYPEKRRSVSALAMELVLFLIIILLEGIITPRSVMIVLLIMPLGPAAALCFGVSNKAYPPLGALLLIQVLLFPVRDSELLLFICSIASALLAGLSADRMIEDGPIFDSISMFSSTLLFAAAFLILAPPFLTSVNAEQMHLVHTRSCNGEGVPPGDSWSFISSDARFLEHYPGILPPGTWSSFLPAGESGAPLPLRTGGELTRVEIREDSPISKEESIAILSDFLKYSGQRNMTGKLSPYDGNGNGNGIPVYLTVETHGDPGSCPVYRSGGTGGTLYLSSLAEFKTDRQLLYIRRWSGSLW
jgi:hypothetical protein